MQRNISLFCGIVWLFLLCFAPVCNSTESRSKCRHDRHRQIHQKTHSVKRFCDPSFSNHTAGAITQKCSSGFFRERAGPFRGQCVPCRCNGLSNECDEQTGNCVNCQFDTTGNHCERCKEGYYGNTANRTCRACPCPSTWNNAALACLEVGSGVVQCLCKRGYSGARCDRCKFGYYGNPAVHGGSCKPCKCKAGLNICDSLTGECIPSGNSSCGAHCHECDSCTIVLLNNAEGMDNVLDRLKQQLQNKTSPGSLSMNDLETHISDTKIVLRRNGTAVRHLGSKAELLDGEKDLVGDDLIQLTDKILKTTSDLEIILQKVNGTKLKAEDLFSEAEALHTAVRELRKQQTEVKPREPVALTENDTAGMMEQAQRIMQEMRERRCAAQRDGAGREQEDAHKLLDIISNNMADRVETIHAVLSQTADSPLREVADLLSDTEDRVGRTQDQNLKSCTALQHLEHLQTQLEREQRALLPVTEMTKDLRNNITNIFLMFEEMKNEFENHAAQLNGAKLELFKKLNNIFQMMAKEDTVTIAEKHADELNRMAALFQQALHNATNSTDLLSVLGIGAYKSIINAIDEAELAANQSRETAEEIFKDVEQGGLLNKAEGLKNNSTHLRAGANETQSDHKMLSHTVNILKNHMNEQEEKGEFLRRGISTVSDNLKKIRGDNTDILIDSVKVAASDLNSTVSNIKERLTNMTQDMERITFTNVSGNTDDMLVDADQALKNLETALPVLNDKITQVEALSVKALPSGNITESIRRIKDMIEETRTFVNRLSVATTFDGKGHIELHTPRNLEDLKAFTAVDLLLNRYQNNPSKADNRRQRRQNKHRDASSFLLYLGHKNDSRDFIGMAIRSSVLICVYKLGGVVHEVETSQIKTSSNVNSSHFDRVIFHRVYQDAEVNITKNFTTQKPVSLPPKRNLPNTTAGVFQLNPDSLVFYVGGYPENFTPPVQLHYPKYRGTMKLSYINDNAVSLFNYKHAVNMDAKQPMVKIPQSEVSDYYEGTGYRMAFIKESDKMKRRLFKFQTHSRETNAFLFYIGNEESFFCVFVERGFLVLRGQQAGREPRVQTAGKVSLFDKHFAITIADSFSVHYGSQQISTDHNQTNYRSYYIGGLPAQLRQRHNITIPPLRGCVARLTADAEVVRYNKTIGVSDGCPVSLLGARSATLYSALSVDSASVWGEEPVRISLGFRSTERNGTLLRSSSQGSTPAWLSLSDGYLVFHTDNYTLSSDKRYSDGGWHYLSAVKRPVGLELSIDNVKVNQSAQFRPVDQNLPRGKFKGCIANLYTRRPEQSFIPTDLSLFTQTGDVDLGLCSLHLPPHTELLPAPVLKRPQKHKPAPAGSQCKRWGAQGSEYQLSERHSWLSYTLPQKDLNYRPHFSLDIKTKSSKGMIVHVAGRGVIPMLVLYMASGKIKMSLGQNRTIQHKQKSNDGNWHRVELSVEKSTFHLLVDGIRVTDGHLPNDEGASLDLHNPAYLGAGPKSKIQKGYNIPMNSVTGCVRDFRMNEVAAGEPEASYKTLPCFDGLIETGTYFGGGHIILDNYFTMASQFVLAFELRPRYLTGLLFNVQDHKTSLNVFLMETKVGVKVRDANSSVSVSVTPPESLCDGKFHVIKVSKQRGVIKLVVDSMSEQKAIPFTSISTTPATLYIGGTTKENHVPVPSSPFVGCLRNVKLNARSVTFETGSRVVDPVSINKCPAE